MKHFNDIIDHYRHNVRLDSVKAWDVIESMGKSLCDNQDLDKDIFWDIMKDFQEEVYGEHFNEPYAEWQVEHMYHTDKNGHKIHKPWFTMSEAKSVYDKKIKGLNKDITICDVYVALNAQYHDNINLYEKWFPQANEDELEAIIIESTINDWFDDEDASAEKVWRYFRAV